jgi:hypothetical protein
MKRAGALVSLASLLAGCFRSLPPPQPPAPRVDGSVEPTLEPGLGRVLLDVAPGRVRVDDMLDINAHKVRMLTDVKTQEHTEYFPTRRVTVTTYTYEWQTVTDSRLVPLCEAPCALTLSTGKHTLHLQSIDDGRWATVDVNVTSTPQRYRVGLGRTASGNDWLSRFLVGSMLLTPGIALLSAGAVDFASINDEPTPADHDRIQGDAIGLTFAGGILLAAGITAFVLTRPPVQDTVVQVDAVP